VATARKNKEGARTFRASQPFEFVWEFPKSGFECVQARPWKDLAAEGPGEADIFLTEKFAAGVKRGIRRYKPLEHTTGLFKQFGDAEPTQEGVIDFANHYGCLGGGFSGFILRGPEEDRDASPQPLLPGERLSDWQNEIVRMRRLLALWEATRANNLGELQKIIRWEDTAVFAEWPTGKSLVASSLVSPDIFSRFNHGDLVKPAWYHLQAAVNDQLEKHTCAPRLLWDRQLSLFVVPTSLIAAMWFQFASAIDGDRDYRVCKRCRRWFQVGGGARRADSEHCSRYCKQKYSLENRKGKSK